MVRAQSQNFVGLVAGSLLIIAFVLPLQNFGGFVATLLRPLVVVAIAALSFVIAALAGLVRIRSGPIVGWALAFAFAAIVSFLNFQSALSMGDLRTRLLSLLLVVVCYAWFTNMPAAGWRLSKRIFLVLTIFVVINLAFELRNGVGIDAEGARVGGLYVNPNIAASVLLVGMIAAVGVWSVPVCVGWCSFAGFGILLTQSRGASIAWFILTVLLAYRAHTRDESARALRLGKPQVVAVLLVIAIVVSFVDIAVLPDAVERISNPAGYGLGEDSGSRLVSESRLARLEAISLGIQRFSEHPLAGNGIGYFHHWDHPQGPHNMYVGLAVDYGLFGLFLIPALMAAVGGTSGRRDRHSSVFAVFIGIWALMSHNVVDETAILMGAAYFAASLRTQGSNAEVTSRPVGNYWT